METRTTAEHDRIAFGEFLRQARERRRLTLEQIAGETKIAPRLLTSLEQGNLQPMPKGMYRRAMLRAYAESVGLDTDAALTEFERTFQEPPPREVPLRTLPQPAPPHSRPVVTGTRRVGAPLAIAVAGVLAATALGIWIFTGDPAPRPLPQPAGATPTEAVSSPVVVPPVATAPATASPAPSAPAPRPTATSGVRDVAAAAPAPAKAPATPLATEGRLVILSDPTGARVTVNGVGWGATPLTIQYLPLGEKRVRVTKAGYISAERTVRVDGNRPSATVRLTLRERP
jgi:cytoskeletal protein RodZ